jgi:hypothetical protein
MQVMENGIRMQHILESDWPKTGRKDKWILMVGTESNTMYLDFMTMCHLQFSYMQVVENGVSIKHLNGE